MDRLYHVGCPGTLRVGLLTAQPRADDGADRGWTRCCLQGPLAPVWLLSAHPTCSGQAGHPHLELGMVRSSCTPPSSGWISVLWGGDHFLLRTWTALGRTHISLVNPTTRPSPKNGGASGLSRNGMAQQTVRASPRMQGIQARQGHSDRQTDRAHAQAGVNTVASAEG